MDSIKLQIPARDNNASVNVNPSVDHIQRILEGLPLANPAECCLKITKLVYQLNRAPIDVKVRIRIMAILLPLFDDIANSLRNNYTNATLPLSDKRQQLAMAVRRLLVEMSHAYKIIVMDMVEQRAPENSFLPQAIYYAITILSRLLVDNYTLYATEPRLAWLEINQLYHYAEQRGFNDSVLEPLNAKHEPTPASVSRAYKRIVLLALANPYHLMRGEAIRMFKRLQDWCKHCNISSLHNARLPDGRLFVDLAVDAPPMYAPKTQNGLKTIEARLLEITGLLASLDAETRRITIECKNNASQSNLGRRMERDMYFRWAEAWGLRRERMSLRKAKHTPARILCGVTAAHHFISGGKTFTPEKDEIRLRGHHTDKAGAADLSLSLVPESHQPWLQEDEKTTMRGLSKTRDSQFDALTNTSDKDLWVKVFTTSDDIVDEMTGLPKSGSAPVPCEIRNLNQGGFGIYSPSNSNFPARVGELIASQTDTDPHVWAIGSSRWMRLNDKQGFEMGVKLISEDASAVGIKATQGIGKGSEYYRGLLLPNLDPIENPTTLITPAAVYDVGTLLIMSTVSHLIYVKLTRQLEATSSYSHYQFDIIPTPEEPQKIDRLNRPGDRSIFG